MKVSTMRSIDYYAGVPMCFIVSLLSRFKATPKLSTPPQKVALIELSEMGSAILVDPAMRLMQQRGAELYFVIFKKNAASLQLLNTVKSNNIFTLRDDGLVPLLIDTLRFLLWCRKKKIDTIIDLELFSRFTALLTGLSGAARKIGYYAFHNEGLYRGNMLSHNVSYNPHIHISKNFIALVNAAYSDNQQIPYSKTLISDQDVVLAQANISTDNKSHIRTIIKKCYAEYNPDTHRIVLINPNASELLIQRRWMPENYIAVMKKILAHYDDVIILITGAENETAEAQQLKLKVDNQRCINFAGQLKLLQLPMLYSVSTLMLTNDSGPGHFSAITDLKTYVIFGPETPALYGSLGNSTAIYAGLACSPCVSASNHRNTPCRDNVCLQVISVDQVFDTIIASL